MEELNRKADKASLEVRSDEYEAAAALAAIGKPELGPERPLRTIPPGGLGLRLCG